MGIGNSLIGDVEELMVARGIRRGELFRMTGPNSHCWKAECDLERMYAGTRCLLLPSASTGCMLLLDALDLEPGSTVLISPFGWIADWSCLKRAGLEVGFLPLDRDLQLCPDMIQERFDDRTSAVIVTHLMGRGQQAVGDIADLCRDRGIPLLEDVAQAFGVSVRGQRAGTFGVGAWCSFNHHKTLSTGDGGFVTVRDEGLFARIEARHDQGCIMVDGKRRPHPELEPGLSLRVSELTGAVVRAQIARYPAIRHGVLALHDEVRASLEARTDVEVIRSHRGDVPFTVLVRGVLADGYPSLYESGWHVAENVPWLREEFLAQAAADPALADTTEHLRATSAIGSGFLDPYYGIAGGVDLTMSSTERTHALACIED